MKRILVTAGAGFLGSHLCTGLVDAEHDVLCIDNYYTGRRKNVYHLLDRPNFEVVRHDVTFPLYVEVDEIYNLACPASPVHYQHDPVQTTKTCVHGAINMLGLAKRCGTKILQASTSEVYGDPLEHPQTESYWGHVNPVGPRSFCYVDDLVDGMIRIMEDTDDAVTGPINLGNPAEMSVLELAEEILTLTGSASKIIHMPAATDDPRQRQPNIDLVGELTGWKPSTALRTDLEQTVAYFREELAV